MWNRTVGSWKRALLSVMLSLGLLVPTTIAQEAPPPEVGPPILEDALNAPGAFEPLFTATGRNSAQFAGQGLRMQVSGKSSDAASIAYLVVPGVGVQIPDGEVEVEARFVSGVERTRFLLWTRASAEAGYNVAVEPTRGLVQLRKWVNQNNSTLAERTDLLDAFGAERWTRLALRVQGSNLWVLIDGKPVLTAVDTSAASGGISLGLIRTGSAADEQETSVVLRNLRISPIAGGAEARSPTHQPGQAPVTVALPEPDFVPPVGSPPEVGAVVTSDPLKGPGLIPTGVCGTGRGSSERVAEGLLLEIRGRCSEQDPVALVETPVDGLTVPDGEISFEMRPVSGADRMSIVVYTRVGERVEDSYAIAFRPVSGSAAIGKNAAGQVTSLELRSDLARLFDPFDWNTVSVRLQGPRLWLLVNGRPAMTAEDPTFTTGGVRIRLVRIGDPDDPEEVSVLLRNFKASALAGSAPARAPTYQAPVARAD